MRPYLHQFPLLIVIISVCLQSTVLSQALPRRENNLIPAQVERLYTKGLRYLTNTQNNDGSWGGGSGARPGVVGLCVLAFLAYGEDPNHGPQSTKIRKAIYRNSMIGKY